MNYVYLLFFSLNNITFLPIKVKIKECEKEIKEGRGGGGGCACVDLENVLQKFWRKMFYNFYPLCFYGQPKIFSV